ncbi:hypothetical protein [Mesorhizobium sp. M0435]|uniref:hypothetical protein n=1 Tax=Mesorhizobium sp. M0435 TaxID=2956944 RepID=UPI003338CC17
MHYRFAGSDSVFEHQGPWTMDPPPRDVAFAPIEYPAWRACQHQAAAIPYSRFALAHQIVEPAELLFFRGYAGENAHHGFGVHDTSGSGYCTHEKKGTGDDHIFELIWEPENTQFTASVSPEARKAMKFTDARGFSGSLVWNTRYLEVSRHRQWTSQDAVVTGFLRRWDQESKTLLAWRVEHLRAWLDTNAGQP